MPSEEVKPWISQDLPHALDMLAKRAVVARKVRVMRKQAAGLGDAWNWLNESGRQPLRMGLAGAGLGALAGGVSSFARPKEERQTLNSAMNAALAGGALGLGGGLLAQYGPQMGTIGESQQPPLDAATKKLEEAAKAVGTENTGNFRKALGTSAALGGGSELWSRFLNPKVLQRGALSPLGAVFDNPAQANQIKALRSGGALREGDTAATHLLNSDLRSAIAEAHGLRNPFPTNAAVNLPAKIAPGTAAEHVFRPNIPGRAAKIDPRITSLEGLSEMWHNRRSPFTMPPVNSTQIPGFANREIRALRAAGGSWRARDAISKGRTGLAVAIPLLMYYMSQGGSPPAPQGS